MKPRERRLGSGTMRTHDGKRARRSEFPVVEMASRGANRQRISVTPAELEQRIRERAYDLFERRGSLHGFHEQDWYEAESQLRKEFGLN